MNDRQIGQLAELTMGMILDELADRVAGRVLAQLGAGEVETPIPEPWHLLDVEAVGAMLGRSKRWVHGAVKERGLPFIRLDGGALAFDPDDVREWVRARRVPAEDPETLAGRWQDGGKPAPLQASQTRRLSPIPKARAHLRVVVQIPRFARFRGYAHLEGAGGETRS